MALELASVSSMISEILIKIGLKMTIFIYEFFGISLDAFTVSLYNRVHFDSKLGATSNSSFDVSSMTSPFRMTLSSTKSATGPVNTEY